MDKNQIVKLKMQDGKLSQEEKRSLITAIMLSSNRIFMSSKIGPADECIISGKNIHFLEPLISSNNMLKSMKVETKESEDDTNSIILARTVNSKDKQPQRFEQIVTVEFISVDSGVKVIEADFFKNKREEQVEEVKQEFEPGVLLLPNGSFEEAFIYWPSKQLNPHVKYKQATMDQRIFWEKRKGMQEVKTFSGLGGSK